MRAFTALILFLAVSTFVVGIAAIALWLGAGAVGGLVFAVLWSVTAIVLTRWAYGREQRRTALWALAGLVLGPFVAAWLAWKSAPAVLAAARR
jgi:hypothetical protein